MTRRAWAAVWPLTFTCPVLVTLQVLPAASTSFSPEPRRTKLPSGEAAGLEGVGDDDGVGVDAVGLGLDAVGLGLDAVGLGLDAVGLGLDAVGLGLDVGLSV